VTRLGTHSTLRPFVLMMIAAGVLSAHPLSAQTQDGTDGAQLFRNHCASCHGANGHGDGPAAFSLRKPPADLTKFAHANGGVFPVDRLKRIIDGRGVPSHGDRDMPVWGVTLRNAGNGDGSVEARIEALVRYIQALQERVAQ